MVMTSVVSVLASASCKPIGRRGDKAKGEGNKAFSLFPSPRRPVAFHPFTFCDLDDSTPHPALYAIEQQSEGRPLHERSYFFPVSSCRAAQGRP